MVIKILIIVLFVWLLFFRNDQLQQEINVLQDRNKTDLTNLKKSLDDAIERCRSDKISIFIYGN